MFLIYNLSGDPCSVKDGVGKEECLVQKVAAEQEVTATSFLRNQDPLRNIGQKPGHSPDFLTSCPDGGVPGRALGT